MSGSKCLTNALSAVNSRLPRPSRHVLLEPSEPPSASEVCSAFQCDILIVFSLLKSWKSPRKAIGGNGAIPALSGARE